MRMAAFGEHLRVLAALLRGESADYTCNGTTKSIRMLLSEPGYGVLEPKTPLYVSGFGPRAMGLAGEHGEGLVFATPPRGVPVAEALGHVRQGSARRGRDLTGLHTCTLTSPALWDPCEAADSERIKASVGPNVMASVY